MSPDLRSLIEMLPPSWCNTEVSEWLIRELGKVRGREFRRMMVDIRKSQNRELKIRNTIRAVVAESRERRRQNREKPTGRT